MRIEGSAGNVYIDDRGYPIKPVPEGYKHIERFDIRRLELMCTANHISVNRDWDILAVGYWTHDGNYEEPATMYSESGVMRHIWAGHAEDLDEAYEYEEENY